MKCQSEVYCLESWSPSGNLSFHKDIIYVSSSILNFAVISTAFFNAVRKRIGKISMIRMAVIQNCSIPTISSPIMECIRLLEGDKKIEVWRFNFLQQRWKIYYSMVSVITFPILLTSNKNSSRNLQLFQLLIWSHSYYSNCLPYGTEGYIWQTISFYAINKNETIPSRKVIKKKTEISIVQYPYF